MIIFLRDIGVIKHLIKFFFKYRVVTDKVGPIFWIWLVTFISFVMLEGSGNTSVKVVEELFDRISLKFKLRDTLD